MRKLKLNKDKSQAYITVLDIELEKEILWI